MNQWEMRPIHSWAATIRLEGTAMQVPTKHRERKEHETNAEDETSNVVWCVEVRHEGVHEHGTEQERGDEEEESDDGEENL